VTRASGIVCLAAIGATTAMLWLAPAAAGEQTVPGATVESVVAIAKRLNPTVAAENGFQTGSTDLFFVFEAERRLRAVQLDLLKLKVELQTKYAEMERLAGGSL
jgi:hypothetical protein